MFQFIGDEEELKWFYNNIFIQPEIGESYLATLAARNKALTEEERVKYKLGRSEMMRSEILHAHKEGIISWEEFFAFSKRFNFDEGSMLTKSNLPYPVKSLVFYFYINPSSERKVSDNVMNYIISIERELFGSYEKNYKEGIKEGMYKLSKISYISKSLHAQSISRKNYIDFDLDADPNFLIKNYNEFYDTILSMYKKGSFFISQTKGGWHILVKTSEIKSNPNELPKKFYSVFEAHNSKELFKEMGLNSNGFFQLPGSISRDHIVRILNKTDF